MKKEVLVIKEICDVCQMEEAGYDCKCIYCGKVFCHKCREHNAVQYRHAINVSGSGDGLYCLRCEAFLSEDKSNPLHNAYVELKDLIKEGQQWRENFGNRKAVAEANLEHLLKEGKP